MSNPTRPTQQQLDELESLMQRMLALPVNQLDDEPASATALPSLPPLPEWESAPEEPPLLSLEKREEPPAAAPEVRDEEIDVVAVAERVLPALQPPEDEPRGGETLEKSNAAVVTTPEPVVPVLRAPIVVRPAEEEGQARKPRDKETRKPKKADGVEAKRAGPKPPVPLAPTPAARNERPAAERRIDAPARRRPGALPRALLWCNRTFDRSMGRLGAPGRWLRGRYGRAFLGVTGVLLLAAAVVLGTLDWIGWTW